MSLPPRIAGRDVAAARPVGGGDINAAFLVELGGGVRAFVKTRDGAAPGEFAAEAAGLRWLGDGGARVPAVLEATDALLALEWLEPSPLDAGGEEELGRMLATMHRAGAPASGSLPGGGDTLVLGSLSLPSAAADDWPSFYAGARLRPLLDAAGLPASGRRAVEAVCDRIGDLAGPPEPPSRLHGDLWSGNVHASGGRPVLVDPAAYGGHREVDLAMLRLFGAPSPRTLAAYAEVWPLAEGHEDRVALWQLLPLLVHAVLFGGGYVASAERAARRYA